MQTPFFDKMSSENPPLKASVAIRRMVSQLQTLADELDSGAVVCGEGAGMVARTKAGWRLDLEMWFPLKP